MKKISDIVNITNVNHDKICIILKENCSYLQDIYKKMNFLMLCFKLVLRFVIGMSILLTHIYFLTDPQHKNEVPEDITKCEGLILQSSKQDASYEFAEVSTIHDVDITTNSQAPSVVNQRILSDSPVSPTLKEENKNIPLKPVNQFQYHSTQHGESWVPDDEHQPVTAKPDLLGMLDVMRAGGCVIVAFLTCWSFSFGMNLLFLEVKFQIFSRTSALDKRSAGKIMMKLVHF